MDPTTPLHEAVPARIVLTPARHVPDNLNTTLAWLAKTLIDLHTYHFEPDRANLALPSRFRKSRPFSKQLALFSPPDVTNPQPSGAKICPSLQEITQGRRG